MTVKEARDMLSEKPEHLTQDEFDSMDILLPMGEEFDGYFVKPCIEESGISELSDNEEGDGFMESFIFAPHGFFEPKEGVPAELN